MTESKPAATSRIVGLRTSAGPLRNVALEISDGVTAMYGRNGAGKSWILDALRKASRGERMELTHLIVEIAPRSEASYWYAKVTRDRDSYDPNPVGKPAEAIRTWFTQGGRYFTPAAHSGTGSPEDLIAELQGSQYLALVPVGVTEPRWEVWVCADAHPRPGSAVQAALDEFDAIERAFTALYDSASELCGLDHSPDEEVWNRVTAQVEALSVAVGHKSDNWAVDDMLNPPPFPTTSMTSDELAEAYDKVDSWFDDIVGHTFESANAWVGLPIASWLWNNDDAVNLETGSASFVDSKEVLRNLFSDTLPFPVACVGEVTDIPWAIEDESEPEDLDQLTSRHFTGALAASREDDQQDVTLTPELKSWADTLEREANTIYRSLLQDAPTLELDLLEPHEWTISTPVEWKVHVTLPHSLGSGYRPTTTALSITDLSTAESRWARIAIRRALDRTPVDVEPLFSKSYSHRLFKSVWSLQRSDLIMLDEPEAALHRAAEQHMARGLDGLTVVGPQVVVATHSPELLNRSEVSLVHVKRTESGETRTSQMSRVNLESSAQELGLRPSDLIGMFRVFLLVEGEHDEVVLQALLPDVLESARVKIIAVRGGAKLPSTTESQLLFDMTSAHMVAMLDNVSIARVEQIWDGAQERYLTAGADTAIEYLTGKLRELKGDEYTWLSTWLSRALKKRVHQRLTPFGLEFKDIIEYLPVEVLVPKAKKTWQELRAEHTAALPGLNPSKGLGDFKRWLKHAYQADTSVTSVRRAANAVTEVPHEFIKLGNRLREISARPPMS